MIAAPCIPLSPSGAPNKLTVQTPQRTQALTHKTTKPTGLDFFKEFPLCWAVQEIWHFKGTTEERNMRRAKRGEKLKVQIMPNALRKKMVICITSQLI